MSMIDRVAAYVRLLDEGIDVWRPCYVHIIDNRTAIVLSDNYSSAASSENWECKPGDTVEIEKKNNRIYVYPHLLEQY